MANYVDYEYYKTLFGEKAIPEADFNRLVWDSCKKIDNATTGVEDVKKVIKDEVFKFEEKHITDWSTIKSTLKDTLRDYIFEKTKRDPMILPIIMEI